MTTSDNTDARRPSRRSDGQRNHKALIGAAQAMFAEEGLDASMLVIAQRAGLGVATAYRHFANKFELADVVLTDVIVAHVRRMNWAVEGLAPGRALLRLVDLVLELQAANRAVRDIILVHNLNNWALHDTLLAPLQTALKRAHDIGAVGPGFEYTDLKIVLTMLCLVSSEAGPDAPNLWRRYKSMVTDAVRADAQPLPGLPVTQDAFRAGFATGLLRYSESAGD